ncbi:coiled-coil domain-containing protein 106-like [Cyprinodon tularosa]|uniref:coiled-coil domain-containing protein 106-like n=1 Tax=Cyprinodon tularosa TaxID=77115 RepID=UPI0018E26D6F|nr:coiled-coil domain-containing protein 106-like [Cyprinodon tularosa]
MSLKVPEDDLVTGETKKDLDGLEDKGDKASAPSCSSISSVGSGSISKVEFLGAKIQWQEKIIKDLEQERNFLREQITGKKRSSQSKVLTLEDNDEDDDGNMDEDDIIPPSSPDISESSDSDVVIQRKKKRPQPFQPLQVATATCNCCLKGPAEVISRYKKVLKSLSKVRTMTEAFRINGVDRGTIKMTAPIAELHIVDPVAFSTLKYDPATETLQSFAKRCATHITPEKKRIIEDMKAKCQLLPLLMKY